MSSTSARLIRHPFPALSRDLPHETRALLMALENHLASSTHARTLVRMGESLDLDPLLLLVDRLLRFTDTKSLLLLVSAATKPALLSAWKQACSPENRQPFSERYRISLVPLVPLAPGKHICISTVRVVQLCLQRSRRSPQAFPVVLAYDIPTPFSPVWQHVLEALTTSYLIGFCRALTPTMREWFGGNVVGREEHSGGEPSENLIL